MTHSHLLPLPRQRSAAFAIMIVVVTLIVGTLLKLPSFQPQPAHAQTFNGLANAPTPPMGWDPWNFSHCSKQYTYNESYYKTVADSFVSTAQGTSLKDAGYTYIMLGCGVNGTVDNNGNLVPTSNETTNWPNGFGPIIQYIHSKGLKVEFYTVPETYCSPISKADYPAYGNEQALATAFARAGIDAVKYDWCFADQAPYYLDQQDVYNRMHQAIAGSGRPMILEMSEYGSESPWNWGPVTGTLWRTGNDIDYCNNTYSIGSCWSSLLANINANNYPAAAGPGGWNFPDMLEVGVPGVAPGGLSAIEQRTMLSMWAEMAAPLWLGNDTQTMSQAIHDELTNSALISVDQDTLGVQGTIVSGAGSTSQVWSKRLAQAGTRAIALFNSAATPASITANWMDLGLTGNASVYDIWNQQSLGAANGSYTTTVPAHGTVFLKLTGTEGPQNLPVSQWNFSEGASTIVQQRGNRAGDSFGGAPGTVTGATWQTGYGGGANYALNFQSANHACVDAGDQITDNFSGQITVGGWVWIDSAASEKVIIGKGWDGSTTPWWLSVLNPTTIRFGHYQNGLQVVDDNVGTSLLNGWHFVIGEYDGTSYKVSVDGQAPVTAPGTGVTTSTSHVTIGCINETNPKYFDGTINQMRLYNRALSQTDITNWYKS